MISRLSDPSLKRLALAFAFSVGAHAVLLAHLAGGSQSASAAALRWPLTLRLAESEPTTQALEQTVATPQPEAQASVRPENREPADSSGVAPDTGMLPALEHYYRGSEVDQRAEPLSLPDFQYPEAALSKGISGTVTLRLLVDRHGVLRDAEIVAATPAGIFEEVALRAARSLSFRPAMRNGQAVGSIKLIEVPFYPNCQRTGSCMPQSAAQ